MPISGERAIESQIMRRPESLGFPNAPSVRNMRVHLNSGLVDVALFPIAGPIKLGLVEVKLARSVDGASKVIGQLLMYYAGALRLGMDGIETIREFALTDRKRARDFDWVSPKVMTGGISPPGNAWKELECGRKLRRSEIALFVAVEDKPRQSLRDVVKVLKSHHLRIDIYSARERRLILE